MAKDIFKEPLHPVEGIQEFSKKESLANIKRLKKSDRKRFCVIKDEKPSFFGRYDGWKQTYSIQRKDKMKVLGKGCLRS